MNTTDDKAPYRFRMTRNPDMPTQVGFERVPLTPNCNQNGREIRFGEKVVAKVGTASTSSFTDDAIADLIVRSVNEHEALLHCKAMLEQSQMWLAKFMADRDGQSDESGIVARCNKQFNANAAALIATISKP